MIIDNSVRDAKPITLDQPFTPCHAIWVGTSGNLSVVFYNKSAPVVFPNVPVGIFYAHAQEITSAGTTASNLLACYI